MLLGEPPRSQYDLNFVLFGIPVRVHPFFWLIAVMLGIGAGGELIDLLVWVVAVFISILCHELGHAMTMRAYGFTPWITLYSLGGLASYNRAQTYRSKGFGTLGQILISAAGPAAGFLLGAVVIAAVRLSGHPIEVTPGGTFGLGIGMGLIGSPVLTGFLYNLLFISLLWGIVNLLPVYPLDGGQIAREILLRVNPHGGIRQSLMLSVFTAAGVAVIGLAKWNDWFVAIFFGYLAYSSYTTLMAYEGRGRGC